MNDETGSVVQFAPQSSCGQKKLMMAHLFRAALVCGFVAFDFHRFRQSFLFV